MVKRQLPVVTVEQLAQRAGYFAALAGKGKDDNPHGSEPDLKEEWDRGHDGYFATPRRKPWETG